MLFNNGMSSNLHLAKRAEVARNEYDSTFANIKRGQEVVMTIHEGAGNYMCARTIQISWCRLYWDALAGDGEDE
jgi:hypothetical protein